MLIVSVCMELEILGKTNHKLVYRVVGSGVGAKHEVLGLFFFYININNLETQHQP